MKIIYQSSIYGVKKVEECSAFNSDDTIEQGTIISFTNNTDIRYGIIITADCDIYQNKYGQFLSYCPIFPLREYIETDLHQKLCKRKLHKLFEEIKKLIKEVPEYALVSDEAIEDKLNCLRENDKKEEDFSDELNGKIINYNKFNSKGYFTVDDYKQLCNTKEKELINIVKNFPGDKFYINKIPNNENEGFVVNLRRIIEISEKDISRKILSRTLPQCIAIAKLNSPYKEKMSQTLGAMFSAIGLSIEYESQRDENIKNIVGDIMR